MHRCPLADREIRGLAREATDPRRLGFSLKRLRALTCSPAVVEHDGCINTASWDATGEWLYTGSDDRTVKVWHMVSPQDVSLAQVIDTHHLGNIFTALPKPDDLNVLVSGAADGSVRLHHVQSTHSATTLLQSESFIHKIIFDSDQPSILYTAEECGHIHRIDLRFGRKELVFEHRMACYDVCTTDERRLAGALFPTWGGLRAVKAVAQAPFPSAPHLLVGGRGYFVGLLDLRIVLSSSAPNATQFAKLWSPALPYDNDSMHNAQLLERYSVHHPGHPFGRKASGNTVLNVTPFFPDELSLSGLDISGDGKRMVASYQGDQIFAFNLRSSSVCTGAAALIGGHINYATFLKSVALFGPDDEYVTAGSDSGHMWIWRSSPSDRGTGVCPLVNVVKADPNICNGVVPHPHLPVLVSYGLADTAKVWSYETPDEAEKEEQDASNPQRPCRHLGPSDRSMAYLRLSLPLSGFPTPRTLLPGHSARNVCDVHSLPGILQQNSEQAGLVAVPRRLRAVGPFQFQDAAHELLEELLQTSSATALGDEERTLRQADLGSFLPAHELLRIVDDGALDLQALVEYVQLSLGAVIEDKGVPARHLLEACRRFSRLFSARRASLLSWGHGFLHFMSSWRRRWLPHEMADILFLPLLRLYQLVEVARQNGNCAFRSRHWALAHYFYCKAVRYGQFFLSLAEDFEVLQTAADPDAATGNAATHSATNEADADAISGPAVDAAEANAIRRVSLYVRSRATQEESESEDYTSDEPDFVEGERVAVSVRGERGVIENERGALENERGVQYEPLRARCGEAALAESGARVSMPVSVVVRVRNATLTALVGALVPEMVKTCMSNLAATFLAMDQFTDALHVCADAQLLTTMCALPSDAKLLFRKGTALLQLGKYEEATEELAAAKALAPQDAGIAAKLKNARRLRELKRKREAQAFSRMFSTEEG